MKRALEKGDLGRKMGGGRVRAYEARPIGVKIRKDEFIVERLSRRGRVEASNESSLVFPGDSSLMPARRIGPESLPRLSSSFLTLTPMGLMNRACTRGFLKERGAFKISYRALEKGDLGKKVGGGFVGLINRARTLRSLLQI